MSIQHLMSNIETPQLTCLTYGTTTTEWPAQLIGGSVGDEQFWRGDIWSLDQAFQQTQQPTDMSTPAQPTDMSTPARRIVKVYIADAHPDVPMEAALIHEGQEHFTDATDQELFFEIGIKDKLEQHNKKRVTWLDKEASKRAGKDIFLEPVKIRELKMVVVTVAAF